MRASTCEVLADPDADVLAAIVALDGPEGRLDLMPASRRLGELEPRLAQATAKELYLREALGPLGTEYDLVLVDTPPNLGVLTINALAAADGVLVPLQPEFLPLQGLGDLSATIAVLRRNRINPDLAITGVVATMATRRLVLEREVLAAAADLDVPLLATRIPRSVRFAEAPPWAAPGPLAAGPSRGGRLPSTRRGGAGCPTRRLEGTRPRGRAPIRLADAPLADYRPDPPASDGEGEPPRRARRSAPAGAGRPAPAPAKDPRTEPVPLHREATQSVNFHIPRSLDRALSRLKYELEAKYAGAYVQDGADRRRAVRAPLRPVGRAGLAAGLRDRHPAGERRRRLSAAPQTRPAGPRRTRPARGTA